MKLADTGVRFVDTKVFKKLSKKPQKEVISKTL